MNFKVLNNNMAGTKDREKKKIPLGPKSRSFDILNSRHRKEDKVVNLPREAFL
jgi:hypothetical protein